MKDWDIEKDLGYIWLWHHCNPYEPGRYICHRNKKGTWYCIVCTKVAPQVIQDVADLAGCD